MKNFMKAILFAMVITAVCVSFVGCVNNSANEIISENTANSVQEDAKNSSDTSDCSIELIRSVQENNGMATIVCKTTDSVVWEYETGKYPMTELEPISDLCQDNERVYFSEGGNLVALDKANGTVIWRLDEALSYGATLIADEKNIYASCYYGPNVVIFSKDGEQLYCDDDSSYYWVDSLEIEGNMLYIYYYGSDEIEIGDEPAVKELDITPYL